MFLSRWLTSFTLASALAIGAVAAFAPASARANDDLIRLVVDLGDVVIRSGHPYYRHGGYGYNDRLIVERDRYGRPIYYRYAPREQYRPPYGNAYGHRRNHDRYDDGRYYTRRKCDSRGRCRVEYYDPRQDRRDDYYSYRRHHNDDHRGWDDRRWKDRDDD
jgi:hypothetical protein